MSMRVVRVPLSDAVIATGLLAAALTEVWVTHTAPGPKVVGTVVAALSTLPLAWRRVWPELGVCCAALGILLPLALTPGRETDGLVDLVAWLVAVHAVNAYRRPLVAGVGTTVLGLSLASVILVGSGGVRGAPIDVAWAVGLVLAAASAGQVLRSVEARHEMERRAGDERARTAERQRIARELHDVVAHGLALMVVQAGAAQELVQRQPKRAAELLEGVQAAGTRAAEELRRLLGLLGDAGSGSASQHRIAELPALVADLERAGLPTSLELDLGHEVAPDVERAAFRVVQEGLTNALKHGVRRQVEVTVRSTDSAVVVDVTDVGSGHVTRLGPDGRGLAGLAERLAFHGGTLSVGAEGADWRIRAVVPRSVRQGLPS